MKLLNNKYQIQGVGLEELADEFGTPLYVYDGEKIINQIRYFTKAFLV